MDNIFILEVNIFHFMKTNTPISIRKILNKIRQTRKKKGLSQENMAFELDISPSTYNKIERHEITLSVERLLKIADLLETPISDIFNLRSADVFNQNMKDNSIGKAGNVYREKKEIIEKNELLYKDLLQNKDNQICQLQDEIHFLRELISK